MVDKHGVGDSVHASLLDSHGWSTASKYKRQHYTEHGEDDEQGCSHAVIAARSAAESCRCHALQFAIAANGCCALLPSPPISIALPLFAAAVGVGVGSMAAPDQARAAQHQRDRCRRRQGHRPGDRGGEQRRAAGAGRDRGGNALRRGRQRGEWRGCDGMKAEHG